MTTNQKPSIGRMVHFYYPRSMTPLPAIVCAVQLGDPEAVSLTVFDTDRGPVPIHNVRRTHIGEYPRWEWPPRVD